MPLYESRRAALQELARGGRERGRPSVVAKVVVEAATRKAVTALHRGFCGPSGDIAAALRAVDVAGGELVGRPLVEVLTRLAARGLRVQPRTTATGQVPAGQVGDRRGPRRSGRAGRKCHGHVRRHAGGRGRRRREGQRERTREWARRRRGLTYSPARARPWSCLAGLTTSFRRSFRGATVVAK